MAPLPPNLTHRGYLDYTGNSGLHTLLVRFVPALTVDDITLKLTQISELVAEALTSDAGVLGGRYSLAGTNFSLPAAVPIAEGGQPDVLAEDVAPRFVSLVGRSNGGRRVRYYLYNTPYTTGPDYRIDDGIPTPLLNLANFLDGDSTIVAIDGFPFVLESYVNVGYNAYFQRKQRIIN